MPIFLTWIILNFVARLPFHCLSLHNVNFACPVEIVFTWNTTLLDFDAFVRNKRRVPCAFGPLSKHLYDYVFDLALNMSIWIHKHSVTCCAWLILWALDLMTGFIGTSITIMTAHNQRLSTTRSIPYCTTRFFSSSVRNNERRIPIHTLGCLDRRLCDVVPVEARIFFLHFVHTASVIYPTSYPMGTGGFFPGGNLAGGGVKLTTHLQLVPRSKKCGSIQPLPHTPSWRST
jgi:hypothetical protein